MVNKDIVKYLKEGISRGFKVERLRKELLNGGFDNKDIDEAIAVVNSNKAPVVQKPVRSIPPNKAVEIKQPMQQTIKAKPAVQQKGQKKSGGKANWMKIAGIMGIILLAVTVIIVAMSLFVNSTTLAGNGFLQGTGGLVFLIVVFVIFLIIYILYNVGFIVMGRRTSKRLLTFSAWSKIIVSVVMPILSVLGVYLIWSTISSVLVKGLGGMPEIGAAVYVVGAMVGLTWLYYITASVLFGVGLYQVSGQIKFGKVGGVLNIVYGVLTLLYTGILVYILTNPLMLIALAMSGTGSAILTFMQIVQWILVLILIVKFIFEIISLFDGAKKFN